MTKTIRWGIIGLGKIAYKFAEALQMVPNSQLLAVASRDLSKAQEFGQKYKVPYCYGNYEEILQNIEVDVIYIATPHTLHYQNTLMCLEAKKAVLTEKPFAVNLRQVQEMIALARKEQVFLMEALWTKFLPSFQKVQELIDSQTIGNIISIYADFGFRTTHQDPQGRLFNLALGGGSLLDVGVYPLFLASTLLGKPQVVKAEAIFNQSGVDESCAMLLSYSQGKLATLTCSIVANQSLEAYICGELGKIRMLSPFHSLQTQIELTDSQGVIRIIPFESEGNGFNYQIAEVNNCLRNGKIESEIMSHQDSLQLMELVDRVKREVGIKI